MAIYSGFTHEKIVIFHSYVSLPEGKWKIMEVNILKKHITIWTHKLLSVIL